MANTNSLDYHGYGILSYLSWLYVSKHFNPHDGYNVIDHDGLPLFGLVAEGKPIHQLQMIKDNKNDY